LTRDTWQGDYTRPLSLNRWNYVEGNPINYTDPSGNTRLLPCSIGWTDGGGWTDSDVEKRVNEAEKHVYHTSDPMDTYVAAGIAIQCAGTDWPKRDEYSSVGVAQVAPQQALVAWEEEILDKNGNLRAYGLRLTCANGELEKPLDPNKPKDAVILMERRIQMVLNYCKKCTATDIYIAAGLAQNGSGFTHINMGEIPKITLARWREQGFPSDVPTVKMDWFKRFGDDASDHDMRNTKLQLIRFDRVMKELQSRRWIVPFIDSNVIEKLKSWPEN
jgi:hypothetical protein